MQQPVLPAAPCWRGYNPGRDRIYRQERIGKWESPNGEEGMGEELKSGKFPYHVLTFLYRMEYNT